MNGSFTVPYRRLEEVYSLIGGCLGCLGECGRRASRCGGGYVFIFLDGSVNGGMSEGIGDFGGSRFELCCGHSVRL